MTIADYIDPRADLRQQVRWYLGDTATGDTEQVIDPLVTDIEIEFALEQKGSNVKAAAAFCARYASTKLLRSDAQSVRLLDFSMTNNTSPKELSDRMLELAVRLESESYRPGIYAGGISVSDKENVEGDTDRVPTAFKRNMHDYPGEW